MRRIGWCFDRVCGVLLPAMVWLWFVFVFVCVLVQFIQADDRFSRELCRAMEGGKEVRHV